VEQERGKLSAGRFVLMKRILPIAAAAAIVLAVYLTWFLPEGARETVGRVRPVYGFVSLKDGYPPKKLAQAEAVYSGQWIRTHTGSRAEIVLTDKSKLLIQPRSAVRIEEGKQGSKILLQQGLIKIAAAKQPAGKVLTIETPASQIKVLGTELDVHVVQKPDGRKQTRVSVTSGRVRLESGGQDILLLPNTEGIADEGLGPLRRSLTVEVNEMLRLIEMNDRLAAESHTPAGVPTIIDFNDDTSARVWTVVSIVNKSKMDLLKHSLKPVSSGSGIRVFSLEGAELQVIGELGQQQIDFSSTPVPPGKRVKVIVRLTDVKGLFESKGAGAFEFNRPASGDGKLSLFQFRLPGSASVDEVSGELIETRKTLSRLAVTMAADAQMPKLFD
ncbi:MAG: FecR domain-containing protein, partial [Planctomycetota bacterium]